jgi:hypothetical protein
MGDKLNMYRVDSRDEVSELESLFSYRISETLLSPEDLNGISWVNFTTTDENKASVHETFIFREIKADDTHISNDTDGTVFVIGALVISQEMQASHPGKKVTMKDSDKCAHVNIISPQGAPNIKCIVFQCADIEERDRIVKSEYCSYHFVGNTLIRFRDGTLNLEYFKLFDHRKQAIENSTQALRLPMGNLDISLIGNYVDEDQISVIEVPEYSYYYMRRKTKTGAIERYQSLV